MKTPTKRNWLIGSLLTVLACLFPANCYSQNSISDFCRVRGQETHVLRGVGIVVGLQGTGASSESVTEKSLSEAMTRSGFGVPRETSGEITKGALGEIKNACIVIVTAEVPPTGASIGDEVRVKVSTYGKTSSLKGGRLMETMLTGGPVPSTGKRQNLAGQLPVLAVASGDIQIEGDIATGGVIERGARIEHEFRNRFYEDRTEYVETVGADGVKARKEMKVRYLNLIVKDEFAGFRTASLIAEQINNAINKELVAGTGGQEKFAQALGPKNIQVRFQPAYFNVPATYARYITDDIDVLIPVKNNKVVMNSRNGVITFGADVTFEPMAFFDGEFKIDVTPFKGLALTDADDGGNGRMKLTALVTALNQIQAPSEKIMEVIKQLKAGGKLYGEVIIR